MAASCAAHATVRGMKALDVQAPRVLGYRPTVGATGAPRHYHRGEMTMPDEISREMFARLPILTLGDVRAGAIIAQLYGCNMDGAGGEVRLFTLDGEPTLERPCAVPVGEGAP